MASFNTPFLFILVTFLCFATVKTQDQPYYLDKYCSDKTTINSAFQINLRNLLFSLSSNATGNTQFYNVTVNGTNHLDSVYGMFMCGGDVPSQLCQLCVQFATQNLSSDCSLSKEAVIWYQECMVRYSDHFFFSTMDTIRTYGGYWYINASSPESFMRLLFLTMNQTADEAAHHPIGDKKYATREAKVSEFQTLYCLAQCTPDLSPQDCRTCLNDTIGDLTLCCEGRLGGFVLYPSCNIRYASYPFYRFLSPTPPPNAMFIPETNTSNADSKFSEDPIYLSHNCSSNKTFIATNTFQTHLTTLLSYLSSKATTTTGLKFYQTDVAKVVFGLFMCRGDLPFDLCEQCVLNATHRIFSECHSVQEAIIWYSHCMIRYSYRNFFYTVDTSPLYSELNITSTSKPNQGQKIFTVELANTLQKLKNDAADSGDKYGKKSLKLNDFKTLYTLVQCTKDLAYDDCMNCLEDVILTKIPWSRLGSVGGRVLNPSCNLRFELFQFYMDGDEAQPFQQENKRGNKKGSWHTIIFVVVPTVVSVTLFSLAYYLLRRATRKSCNTILRENFGHESATLEPLQFSLAVIEAATKNFSNENKIGKGGFGEVYQGILFYGRQVAVKRLSTNSKQGANEFKNEVLLIAKLQHINLVTFIGFCLEEQEKILVYEYVPNKSLDHFLFDSQRQKILGWTERYNIINGIARGILYLYEHSRLKIIHRDLKPSNILLDENMIPKISDFGLARIIEINEDETSTVRIVGT